MLLVVGVPLFFLEMILGQYAGVSSTKVYARMAPGLRGMGYGMVSIPMLINFYYVVIMAYAMYYMFMGFRTELPWATCGDFASDHCYTVEEAEKCAEGTVYYAKQCMGGADFCPLYDYTFDPAAPNNCTTMDGQQIPLDQVTYRSSASEEYWFKEVLNLAVENGHLDTDVNSWTKWGKMRWEILGCLALSWALVCGSLIKGIQSYGKVVYFTTLFPYVVLTITLGYAASLEGFIDGIRYYIVPEDWSQIFEVTVWNDAAGQIFFSLGVAVGSQLLLSSYNGFTTNAHRDAVLIGLCNSLTSIYAGFSVFGVIGYIANKKGADISDVVSEGPGLAFIVYPEAVSLMAVPPLFSFLFFFMLNLLSISSVCGSWEALVAAIMDEFPKLREHRVKVMIGSTFGGFLCGVSMCFDSGFLMFTILNNRTAHAILLMAVIELVTAVWFYGADKILRHVREMGMELPRLVIWYWWTCWVVITPVLVTGIIILAYVYYQPDYVEDYTFPPAAQLLGWLLELFPLSVVIFTAIYVVIKRGRANKPNSFLKAGPLMTPNRLWGPRPDRPRPTGDSNEAFEEEVEKRDSVMHI